MLETRRAKECQRGIAGAAERAKEGGRVPFESSDTRLGAGCREFESLHSDHSRSEKPPIQAVFLLFINILIEMPYFVSYGLLLLVRPRI